MTPLNEDAANPIMVNAAVKPATKRTDAVIVLVRVVTEPVPPEASIPPT
jgi:hypothetical protein